MKKTRKSRLFLLASCLLLILPGLANAGRVNVTWANEYTVDTIYLWIVEDAAGDVDFDRIRLSDPLWSVTMNEDRAILSGLATDPFSLTARIRFSERTDFGVSWAEILDGEIVASGTNRYLGGTWVYNDDVPKSLSPVPLPGSAWLLSGGVLLFLLSSRRRRALAPAD